MTPPDPPSPDPPFPNSSRGRFLPRWIKAIALTLILLGVGLRSTHLDLKPFWEDEVYTIIRVSGYKSGMVMDELDRQRMTVATLEKFRDPGAGRSWGNTVQALASTTEHTPLYFVLLRIWTSLFGPSTTALRSLSAVFSVISLGVVYLLGRSLFPGDDGIGDAAGWGGVTLAALSPLMLRYAQETRPYSLWIIWIGLSTWTLVRVWRSPTRKNWTMYGLTLVLAFYTHLLTLLVMLAHGIALLLRGNWNQAWTRRIPQGWALTTLLSTLVMSPWLAIFIIRQSSVNTRIGWLRESQPFPVLMRSWGIEFGHTWIDFPGDVAPWSLALVSVLGFIGVAIATVYLWRHSHRDRICALLAITVVPTLVIIALDMIFGGQRSAVNRYFIPAYLGLLTLTGSALGGLLAGWVGQQHPPWQKLGVWSGTVALLLISTVSTVQLHQSATWWNLSETIPELRAAIADKPTSLLVTDCRLGQILALAFHLPKEQELYWISQRSLKQSEQPPLPINDQSVILYAPSPRLQEAIAQQRQQPLPAPFVKRDRQSALWYLPSVTP